MPFGRNESHVRGSLGSFPVQLQASRGGASGVLKTDMYGSIPAAYRAPYKQMAAGKRPSSNFRSQAKTDMTVRKRIKGMFG